MNELANHHNSCRCTQCQRLIQINRQIQLAGKFELVHQAPRNTNSEFRAERSLKRN